MTSLLGHLRLPIALACILGSTACQFDPRAGMYCRREPSRESVAGRYTLTTVRGPVPIANGDRPSISLGTDGTIGLRGIPSVWRCTDRGHQVQMDSFDGAWTLNRASDDTWTIAVKIPVANPSDGVESPGWCGARPPADGGFSVSILGQEAPYVLHMVIGDPDAGEGLDFKQPAQ